MSRTTQYENVRSKIHPKKFTLLVAMGSLCMMFAALTSFYVVRKSSGNWLEFGLPVQFYISAGVMLLSSVTVHLSYVFFKKGNTALYRSLLVVTLLLGVGFIIAQYLGWTSMNDVGLYMEGNPSAPTVIVISAIHAAHVLGGIGALLLANLHAFTLPHKVTETRKLRFDLTKTYWHFVDLLWVYLLIFFVTQ